VGGAGCVGFKKREPVCLARGLVGRITRAPPVGFRDFPAPFPSPDPSEKGCNRRARHRDSGIRSCRSEDMLGYLRFYKTGLRCLGVALGGYILSRTGPGTEIGRECQNGVPRFSRKNTSPGAKSQGCPLSGLSRFPCSVSVTGSVREPISPPLAMTRQPIPVL